MMDFEDGTHAGRPKLRLRVQCQDIRQSAVDLVALKLAQGLHGADRAVADKLFSVGHDVDERLPEWEVCVYEGGGSIAASAVLFVGVPSLFSFSYGDVRRLALTTLESLVEVRPTARTLATTIHGVNVGLDESESLKAQVGGYIEAVHKGVMSENLESVAIVDRDPKRVSRLSRTLAGLAEDSDYLAQYGDDDFGIMARERMGHAGAIIAGPKDADQVLQRAGIDSEDREHVFVAMPFAEDWDDVFYFGIKQPANNLGFVCERTDREAFIGDILTRIKQRIETASAVVAEISEPNPNVFLEIGYAWGKGTPTVFVAKEGSEPPFDVRNQKRVIYRRIQDLSNQLTIELRGISAD